MAVWGKYVEAVWGRIEVVGKCRAEVGWGLRAIPAGGERDRKETGRLWSPAHTQPLLLPGTTAETMGGGTAAPHDLAFLQSPPGPFSKHPWGSHQAFEEYLPFPTLYTST